MNSAEVNPDWRGAGAEALEAKVRTIGQVLLRLDDLEELFEHDPAVTHEARALAALLRSRGADYASEATQLRAAISGAAAATAAGVR